MTDGIKDPWANYRPTRKKYNPENPNHFNPFHPPEGYPKELLEKEWGETFDDDGDDSGDEEG